MGVDIVCSNSSCDCSDIVFFCFLKRFRNFVYFFFLFIFFFFFFLRWRGWLPLVLPLDMLLILILIIPKYFLHKNNTYECFITFQSKAINNMKLIPTNSQNTEVNKYCLIPSRIVINTKMLIPIKIQKNSINVILLYKFLLISSRL